MKRLFIFLVALIVSGTAWGQSLYYAFNVDHQGNIEIAAAKLADSLGGSDTSFDSGSDAEWDTALANADYIFIGESSEVSGLHGSTLSDITSWVNSGGVLLVLRDANNLDLLNTVLGSSMIFLGQACCDENFRAFKQAAVLGTAFDAAPASLAALNDFGYVDPASLPGSALIAYADQYSNVHVLVSPAGSGRVAYLSFDWCCDFTALELDEWDAALLAAAGPTRYVGVPTLSEWSTLLLVLMMLGAVGVHFRRTHQT